MPRWTQAIGRMQKRMEDTRRRVGGAYPHWADPETGGWTTTADGDWTGGFWAGMHWLASKHTGEEKYRAQAAALAQGLKNRIAVDTVCSNRFRSIMAPPSARSSMTTGARRNSRSLAPAVWQRCTIRR